MGRCIDLTGRRFGRLTVIKRAENTKSGKSQWFCKCDCGNTIIVKADNIKTGNTKSCGCYASELTASRNYRHGHRYSRLYHIWNKMRQRCYNPKDPKYPRYGARGITVCPEWGEFQVFYEWAIANGYNDNLTIDRLENDGNYCPENCHWATVKEQANNKSNNRIITYCGKTQTLAQWAEELQISYLKLRSRLYNLSWPVEKAFEYKEVKK